MKHVTIVAVGFAVALIGCSGEAPEPETENASSVPTQASEPNYDIPMTNMQAVTIGPYHVQPMYEEELSDGHFNLRITGPEFAAVREWVGPEDASGVVVIKTVVENDYQHGHVEIPDPIPADARLWIEIETPDGEKLKGSVPLMLVE